MNITRASLGDVNDVARLFDAYRQFYNQPQDLARARTFIESRLQRADSVILLARHAKGAPAGFVQLYPSYSSVRTAPILILNDLFVHADFRHQGVGEALMRRAAEVAAARGAVAVELATQRTNTTAKRLYLRMGYVKDQEFDHYARLLP